MLVPDHMNRNKKYFHELKIFQIFQYIEKEDNQIGDEGNNERR